MFIIVLTIRRSCEENGKRKDTDFHNFISLIVRVSLSLKIHKLVV